MKIKNWKKFQHFKDRRPPWIKLHRELLDQRDINMISDRSFRVLIGLWLLASEDCSMDGNLPDIPDIAFRLRMEEKEIVTSLQELGSFVEHSDIDMISEGYQVGPPETHPETETETETETENSSVSRQTSDKLPTNSKKEKPLKNQIPPKIDNVKNYCSERSNGIDPEAFMAHYESKGWLVGKQKMKDWQAAIRTWERNDGGNKRNNGKGLREKPRTFGEGPGYEKPFTGF